MFDEEKKIDVQCANAEHGFKLIDPKLYHTTYLIRVTDVLKKDEKIRNARVEARKLLPEGMDKHKVYLEQCQKYGVEPEEEVKNVESRWHGLLAELASCDIPEVVAKSDKVARPGYSNTKANEYKDSDKALALKVKTLAKLVKQSKKMVVYTGAGISTNSGIADYATKAKDTVTKVNQAKRLGGSPMISEPSIAHRVLTRIGEAGFITRWVQQNHDGLPQKAGFPQLNMNEIHGSWWNPANPVIQMSGTLREDLINDVHNLSKTCDFCLVLGTSLSGMNADQVASRPMERFASGHGLGTAIINIQATQYDDETTVRIYRDCDEVMISLAKELGIDGWDKEYVMPDLKKLEVREDVFVIPYNKDGKLDRDCRMELNLAEDAKIRILRGRDSGTEGEVCSSKLMGHFKIRFYYKVARRKGKKPSVFPRVAVYGMWWIPLLVEGKLKMLEIMNVNPKMV